MSKSFRVRFRLFTSRNNHTIGFLFILVLLILVLRVITIIVTIPALSPVTSTSLNHFKPWPVNHLVVPIGVSHISSWLQEIQSREWEKRTKNERTIWFWVNSSARRLSCDTLHSLCICRLTLACISNEISTKLLGMPIHPDWPSLTAAGPYLMPTGLFCCPVSTGHCPSASPFANSSSGFLLPTPDSRSLAYFRSRRDLELRPLFGFMPKQTKGSSA